MTRYHPSFSDPATSDLLRRLIPWVVVALLLALYTDALAQALTR
jgi:hypothetical protein